MIDLLERKTCRLPATSSHVSTKQCKVNAVARRDRTTLSNRMSSLGTLCSSFLNLSKPAPLISPSIKHWANPLSSIRAHRPIFTITPSFPNTNIVPCWLCACSANGQQSTRTSLLEESSKNKKGFKWLLWRIWILMSTNILFDRQMYQSQKNKIKITLNYTHKHQTRVGIRKSDLTQNRNKTSATFAKYIFIFLLKSHLHSILLTYKINFGHTFHQSKL